MTDLGGWSHIDHHAPQQIGPLRQIKGQFYVTTNHADEREQTVDDQ